MTSTPTGEQVTRMRQKRPINQTSKALVGGAGSSLILTGQVPGVGGFYRCVKCGREIDRLSTFTWLSEDGTETWPLCGDCFYAEVKKNEP